MFIGSEIDRLEEVDRSYLDKCLEEEVRTRMKFDKLLKHDILTGIVLGALVGLYFPLAEYKTILVILAVVMGLKVVATK